MTDASANAGSSTPGTGQKTPPKSADLPDSIARTNYLRAIYRHLLATTFSATAVIIIFIALPLLIFHYKFSNSNAAIAPSFLLVVAASGALGALFSSLFRLYHYEDLPRIFSDENMPKLPLSHFIIYGLVPPFIGFVAATVLYLLFAADLISGSLFPKFRCAIGSNDVQSCKSFEDLMEYFSPASAIDYARALIWGFVAGFSERLVPDHLRNFSLARTTPGQNKGPV
ncbi:hypothetical protein [Prosthecomicrobium hirschii]|uniref:hypothetical protein n=1 Tax=Prosthecodimorpha hirschii TaxID=665126 RepID=UPI00221ED15F|nr:hypothetical protein [Prosthecomicrobium hirschii]MCW1840579.1 hypothetical protein [Prosthecomicrobium hirschii]